MSSKPNILIIDDDDTMLDSCSQVFTKEGYRSATAEDGNQGLQTFREIQPDLVLVDLKMPGKDGIQVLQELKTIDPNCVAIVITGYGTIQSAVEAMKHGAYDFLPKPFTPDELRFIVRRGLERRRYIIETESLRRDKEMMRKNFISLVSHELRSPLAAVQQNLIVILGGLSGDLPEETKKILQRMSHRIKGLISLINDWLDLSRIESGEMTVNMKPVHLPEILTEVVDLVQSLADENKVGIDWHPPVDFPTIVGNRETLQMLFTNLIHNAIKYNKTNGKVFITLENADHHAKVTVKDTGIGIHQEKLPLIFEQFYRAKEGKPVEGSGLGLSIAKKIVEAHQGTIDVESEVGKGTVFTVWLP